MPRSEGRRFNELRDVQIIRGFTQSAPGSVLIKTGQTHVFCTACWQAGVPEWRKGKGSGWLTAEYDMLPGSTGTRRGRNRNRIDGRTQEIQRLVGRALRAVVDLDRLGENSVLVDCDVLQADGGTRTAAITGAYVALEDAIRAAIRNKWIAQSPIHEAVAAVSVGIVAGKPLLDLDYSEDVAADVDMNVVMTAGGKFIEVQGTGEKSTFTHTELDTLIRLARKGITALLETQRASLRHTVTTRRAKR